LFYLVLGILAIFSAIRYTVGNTAYGYRGMEIYLFYFLWFSKYLGSFFVFKTIDAILRFASCGNWFIERRVLNLNNMRDEASDKKKK
jgi:1,4-dihydroxy-2-naphthoate octaprenyltransferase